ncbi:TolB family protein [Kordiimonas sediminis]|nr:PD40 domain-containing protein [Kordiimonas sediminis]
MATVGEGDTKVNRDEIAPRWSDDGNFIYFYSYRDKDPELVHKLPSVTMRMTSKGTDRKILSDRSSRNWWLAPAACTPENCGKTKLYLISERDAGEPFGGSNLYEFDQVTGQYTALTEAAPEQGEWVLFPTRSANGQQLSYIRRASLRDRETSHLFILDLSSGDHREIPLPHTGIKEAVISPDGTSIFYSPNDHQIYRFDMKHRDLTLLVEFDENEGQILDGLSVRSDSGALLFAYGPGNISDTEIYMMDLANSNLTQLTENQVADLRPSWHPSSKKIIFNRIPSPERDWNDIIVYDLESGAESNLTGNASRVRPQ